jgi:uncharacterized protein YjbI with pentapeptide repeats
VGWLQKRFRRSSRGAEVTGPGFVEVQVEGETVAFDAPVRIEDLPDSEFLALEEGHFTEADFSDLELQKLVVIHCRLEECRFERMIVEHASFGGGFLMSTYEGCSFDGSHFSGPSFGRARFENCSFRDVELTGLFGFNAEFIDCVFTGRAKGVVFHGAPDESLADRLDEARSLYKEFRMADLKKRIDEASRVIGDGFHDRQRNEFRGNDFSGMELIDVDFRNGINLADQVLPS